MTEYLIYVSRLKIQINPYSNVLRKGLYTTWHHVTTQVTP
jgi:hypothetical protein